jgi:hypothetical protein
VRDQIIRKRSGGKRIGGSSSLRSKRSARDTRIHWAQEMFDQAGILRELVKWDYELRGTVAMYGVLGGFTSRLRRL